MKKLKKSGRIVFVFWISVLLLASACSNSKMDVEQARKAIMDSINQVNREAALKQNTIDSMRKVEAADVSQHASEQHSAATNSTTSGSGSQKKRMSKTTKGSLIGAGAGILSGAAAGAVISKDKGKGAVVGGIIGGAVGSGIGYGAGAKKDAKVKVDTIK